MSTKKKPERLLPLQNFFAETLRDILENGTLTAAEVARATGIPRPHLSEMKAGRRRITPEGDLRLSRFLGREPGWFSALQLHYDLDKAKREHGAEIEAITPRPEPAEI